MDGIESAGGSAALASFIDEHGEVLIADLLSHYGVDLRDLFHPERPLSPRYVLALVMYLPMGSAFVAARRGGQEFRDWDLGRYALVDVANSLRSLQHMYLVSHIDTRKTRAPKPPDPFPTPEETRTKKATHRPGSFANMVAIAKAAAARKKRKAGR